MSELKINPGPPCPQCARSMARGTDGKTEWWLCFQHGRQEPAALLRELAPVAGPALPHCGHLMDYVLDLHIIVGPNGMCRCGEEGITCSERLRRVSHEIGSALLGAHMAKSMGGEKFTPNEKAES